MVMLRRKLLRDLLHMRGQAIAIALIVASAVAMYVTMRGAYESLLIAQRSYYGTYAFADVFASLKRAPESLALRLRAVDGVAAVQTRVATNVVLDVAGLDEPATGWMLSVPDSGEPALNRLHIRSGREPVAADEVMASEAFAAANSLSPGSTLRAVINGRRRTLRVSGIAITPEYVNETRGQVFPDNRRFGVLWMKRKPLACALGMDGAFNDVSFALTRGASERAVITSVDRILAQYGGLGAYGRDEQGSHRFLRDELAQDRVTAIVIPAVFLVVAAFLIHLLLLRLVTSQREQIAVLKAFGYSNTPIVRHYAGFGVVIVAAGSLAGIPAGIWLGRGLTELYTHFFHFPRLVFSVSVVSIVISVGTALASALIGSVTAVKRVTALPPAEGMRSEPPLRFARGVVDSLPAFAAMTPPLRMIVRSLQRNALRTCMSITALATAGMVLVVGQFSFDALESIIDVQFRSAQSDDATVEFNEVRGASVLHEVRRLPGVVAVEPMRSVPVVVRAGHRSRRTVLVGFDPSSSLRHLTDMSGRSYPLPPRGVVMSKKLAEVIGAREGNPVQIEAMVAPRPVAILPVVSLVDESIGISVYMSRAEVNRFMREGDVVTSAAIVAERGRTRDLYAQLKKTPDVASVALREAMLASFRQTIAENIYISTSMVIGFACIIAFGVIYNGARIALSERGRDLASLRVLGYSSREVGTMLLGEQTILTLVSVPLGFGGGYLLSAYLASRFNSEVYRIPLVISARTYAVSFLIIAVAALFTAAVVQRRVAHLDLVEVLKSRE